MKILQNLYFSTLFWAVFIAIGLLFLVAYVFPVLFGTVKLVFVLWVVLTLTDALLLFKNPKGIFARRDTPERLSNGDENPLQLHLQNNYNFKTKLEIIDEIPFQFQRRDVLFEATLTPHQTQLLRYQLRPTKRGEYSFGLVNVFAQSPLRLLKRRYRFGTPQMVAVYPSFLQMRQFELLAISNRLTEFGVKRIRRIGHSMEFEQIRPYVQGDDVRSLNWKATARRNELMVNAFQDEKSQGVYCLIDKGRVMKSPFEGLTLLDYAINATLVLSNIALLKQDKAGLITFSEVLGQVLPAERKTGQLAKILEILYKQKTRYLESDYEVLYANLRAQVRQRSLLLLFTNFETLHALQRQLPYLRRIAKDHLLIVIFFENTETTHLLRQPATNTKEIYLKTIAERFAYEKKRIVLELQKYGIQSILTAPKDLNANTVNKYLELKSRGMV
ncbi:MAG: DUF58 domain-containing protein [Cytophagia bacterium]|nr:MAG: DUF58 domain-containing protein [Runella sp.]TAG18286.1 MAG: DUF58 domain-containing protein [Cytophagales bacterium]TAG37801.1 MAG: DUF58 domain-containing protein [Cytophagia bacterium]TAG79034.1 MAG: DUF58 domain-containing protein [Cytophagales bacterium]